MINHKLLAAVALAGLFSGAVQATPISTTVTITESGEGSVGYFAFDVIDAGNFDIYTMGPTIDPVLYLFEDDGTPDFGDLVGFNDDGCRDISLCGPAGAHYNSIIDNRFLSIGSYVAAVSDYGFDQDEARIGLNHNNRIGDVGLVVRVNPLYSGSAVAVVPVDEGTVPEPGSLALLAGGALAAGFVGRRRRVTLSA